MVQNPQLERAKQGDPDAIAALMQRSLEAKGISVRAESDSTEILLVTLEGPQAVNRDALVSFIQKGMMQLGIRSLRTVKVEWQEQGSFLTEWTAEIPLDGSAASTFDSVPLSDMGPASGSATLEDVDDGALEDEDDGEFEIGPEDEDDEMGMADGDDDALGESDAKAGKKDKKKGGKKDKGQDKDKKSSSTPLLLLLLLAALLGGLWYLYREGQLDAYIAQLPESVQGPIRQYLPPASGLGAAGDAPVTEETPAPEAPAAETPAAEAPAPGAPAETPTPEAPAAAESPAPEAPAAEAPAEPPAAEAPVAASPTPAAPAAPAQSFVGAVRSATQAAQAAQTARTAQEWSAVAQAWQAAIAGMQAVPEGDQNYEVARDRIPTYERNRRYAETNAANAAQ